MFHSCLVALEKVAVMNIVSLNADKPDVET